jgi:hypothetical protein
MAFGDYFILNLRPGYEATNMSYLVAGILTAIILIIAVLRWKKLSPAKKKTMFWLKTLSTIAIAIIVVFILYSAYVYWYSGVATKGLETCDASGCRISVHWHAELEHMSVCGQTVERPWEAGDLDGPHTHKDNKIHVHTILEINPDTKELIDTYPMTLGGFFDAIKWKFADNCFKDTCDTCNGQPAKTHVMINNKQIEENIRDYVWKDGDKVRIELS